MLKRNTMQIFSRAQGAKHVVRSTLVAMLLAVSATCASAQMIESLVVKFIAAPGVADAPALTPPQHSELANALQAGFSEDGRTRDGAYRLALHPALSPDEARAALNRARMLPGIVYADVNLPADAMAPAPAAKNGLQERLLHRIIVKYRDPVRLSRATQNAPLDRAALDDVARVAGQPVAHERVMGGREYLLRLLRPVPHDQLDAIARRIEEDPQVEFAQADALRFPQLIPNDPLYPQQWHLQAATVEPGGANLPSAWDITTGSASVFIAVVDTGILPHPDLAGRVVGGYDVIDDVLVANDGDLRDPNPEDSGDWVTSAEAAAGYFQGCPAGDSSWHGTHVAGTIGAAANNATGVTGINWVSKIIPVRALGKCGGYLSDIVDGMRWAAGFTVGSLPVNPNPVRVINLSLGGGGPCSVAEQNAINSITSGGTAIVIAAGNENQNASNSSPGNCNGVITVSATGRAGQRAGYSNYGSLVEIAAPGGADGQSVLSTLNSSLQAANPTGYNYEYYQGTSMATPHVAGIVSLMLSVNPALTPPQVLAIIQNTARPFPGGTIRNCSTSLCGAGIIDAAAAVGMASGNLTSTTTLGSSSNPSAPGASVTLTATVIGVAPTGTVAFMDGANIITGCASVTLTGVGNTRSATCSTSALPLGSHSISSTYGGDVGNLGSTSAPLSQVVSAQSAAALPMYRFNTGTTHFYTIWESERTFVQQTFPTWTLEGIAFYAFGAATANTHKVYRYNTGAYHFYTISDAEKAYIDQNYPSWKLEGVAFHAYPTANAGASPVYRFNTGAYHFYTGSEVEKTYVLQNFPSWSYEGVAYYARTAP
jgi:subtilisin family serine protease